MNATETTTPCLCGVCGKPLAPDEGAEVDDEFKICDECEKEVMDVPY